MTPKKTKTVEEEPDPPPRPPDADPLRPIMVQIVEDLLEKNLPIEAIDQWLRFTGAPTNLQIIVKQALERWTTRADAYVDEDRTGKRQTRRRRIDHLEDAFGIKRPGSGTARRASLDALKETLHNRVVVEMRRVLRGKDQPKVWPTACGAVARRINEQRGLRGSEKLTAGTVKEWWYEFQKQDRKDRESPDATA
jgi:hypothetical protein